MLELLRPAKGFPKIYGGPRRKLIVRLLCNGIAQAAVALGLADALRIGLDEARSDTVSWPVVVAMIVAGFTIYFLRIVESADTEHLGQDYVMRVRLRIFERIAALPRGSAGGGRFGVTMTRMVSDLNALRNWVAKGVARASVAGITLVGLIVALTLTRPLTGIIALSMTALCFCVMAGLTPLLQGRVREARRRRGMLANNLGEKVLALDTVRHLGKTRDELARISSQSRRLRDALVRRARTAEMVRTLPVLSQPLALAAIVGLSAVADFGRADVPVMILLLGFVTRSLTRLARAWDYGLSFREARRRISVALRGPRIEERRDAAALAGRGPLGVVVDGVRIDGAMGRFSFAALPGDRVHVRGAPGSGKSSLLRLIARSLDPEAGEILIDGRPLPEISLDSFYEAVQLVSPDLPLLRGSLAENLSYGNGAARDASIDTVAAACGLIDDPYLPDGIETKIEEQGRNLSSGLRARIALARAAAMRPRLLLLDDRSFVVDEEARAALVEILRMQSPTLILASADTAIELPITRCWNLDTRMSQPPVAAAAAPARSMAGERLQEPWLPRVSG